MNNPEHEPDIVETTNRALRLAREQLEIMATELAKIRLERQQNKLEQEVEEALLGDDIPPGHEYRDEDK